MLARTPRVPNRSMMFRRLVTSMSTTMRIRLSVETRLSTGAARPATAAKLARTASPITSGSSMSMTSERAISMGSIDTPSSRSGMTIGM